MYRMDNLGVETRRSVQGRALGWEETEEATAEAASASAAREQHTEPELSSGQVKRVEGSSAVNTNGEAMELLATRR